MRIALIIAILVACAYAAKIDKLPTREQFLANPQWVEELCANIEKEQSLFLQMRLA
jgi:hypothetical protein